MVPSGGALGALPARKKVAGQLGHYEVPENVPVMGPDGKTPLENIFKRCYKSGAVFQGIQTCGPGVFSLYVHQMWFQERSKED